VPSFSQENGTVHIVAFQLTRIFAGTLLTFVQFLFVAVTGFIAQFDKNSRFFLTPNKVPISRWIFNIVLFFTINLLNNHAFSYDISVPVHIILRSGGSITTMAAGYLYGKRYTQTQVVAVFLLTLGVILAAWSDAQAKVCFPFLLECQSHYDTDASQTIGHKRK
jgi:UDP-xylose/UDP-N-acetylglucosamine transporter B4